MQHPDAATLAEVWPLFWQTYLKGRTKFERLTPAFFDAIAAEPAAHFVLLRHAAGGSWRSCSASTAARGW